MCFSSFSTKIFEKLQMAHAEEDEETYFAV